MSNVDQRQFHEKSEMNVHSPAEGITDLLTFRLARLVAVNSKAGNQWMKSNFGISLNDWRVLGLVHQYAPVRIGAISEILLIDKGQLSRVVKKLHQRGFLESAAASDDARSTKLSLTKMGHEVHDKTLEFAKQRNNLVVGSLSRSECNQFSKLIHKLTEHNEELLSLSELKT